jgi:1-acyl-sn-glycerol-3-phosphate acyltransferase
MRKPPATTKFANELGRRVAYSYARRLTRSDVEWETDLPLGAKIIAANHPTTADPFLMMSWPFEPVYILIGEAAFKVPLVGSFLRLAGHIPVHAHRGREAFAGCELALDNRVCGNPSVRMWRRGVQPLI